MKTQRLPDTLNEAAVTTHIGAQIKSRRTMLGISLEELAERLHISYQQMSKYEHGVNRLSSTKLPIIAHMLSVDVSYFYDGLQKNTDFYNDSNLLAKQNFQTIQSMNKLAEPVKRSIMALVHTLVDERKKSRAPESE